MLLLLAPLTLAQQPVVATFDVHPSPSGLNNDTALDTSYVDFTDQVPWLGNRDFGFRIRTFSPDACATQTTSVAGVFLSTQPSEGVFLDGFGCEPGAAGELLIDAEDWIALDPVVFPAGTSADVESAIPPDPALMGVELYAQAVVYSPDLETQTTLTNRLDLRLGNDPDPPGAATCIRAAPLYLGATPGSTKSYPADGFYDSCFMGGDRWYSYVAPCTGTTTISSCSPNGSSDYEMIMRVSTGSCDDLRPIVCSSYCTLFQPKGARIEFQTVAGKTYYVQVGGYEDSFEGPYQGDFVLWTTCTP